MVIKKKITLKKLRIEDEIIIPSSSGIKLNLNKKEKNKKFNFLISEFDYNYKNDIEKIIDNFAKIELSVT